MAEPPLDMVFMGCRAAEELGLPWTDCRRRNCRRRRKCGWYGTTSKQPFCLRNVSPENRQVFDYLMQLVLRVHDHIVQAPYTPGRELFLDADPGIRMLQDCAVRIVQISLPDREQRSFGAWMRYRRFRRERLVTQKPAEHGPPADD